jgi:hypothetical protein
MAIIVEEENNRGKGSATLLGWIIIVVVVLIGAYEIFFAAPSGSQVVVPPSNFSELTSLSQITLSPQDVVSSSSFQSLKQYVGEPSTSSPAAVGRTNPFVQP